MVINPNKPSITRLIVTIAIGLGLSTVTYSLGQWQSGRAEQKLRMLEKQRESMLAAPVLPSTANLPMPESSFRRLDLIGQWLEHSIVYVDNRQVGGRPAVQVIQAFQPAGKDFVIPVDRGLLLRDPAQPRRAPDMPSTQPEGEMVSIEATVLPYFARSAELRGLMLEDSSQIMMQQANGYRVWSNFSLIKYEKLLPLKVTNFVATLQPVLFEKEQDNKTQIQNGFYLNAVKLPEQVAKHKGYAFQWYTMTFVLILLSAWFIYRENFVRSWPVQNKEGENE